MVSTLCAVEDAATVEVVAIALDALLGADVPEGVPSHPASKVTKNASGNARVTLAPG
jgi:hypothetical protein